MFGYVEPYPITLLRIYPAMAKFAEVLTHRDYLGSLVGLGIEREKIGDIIIPRNVNEDKKKNVYVFVTEGISEYIIENLGYVKHTHVRVERCEDVPDEVAPQLEELSVIVSSNRLDAIIAKLYNLSREQSLKLITEGKVFLNGINMTSNARPLKEGEVVSVRGYGKFVFDSEGGNTRKDKLYVNVRKYV
jgi:RNA-binding protein YlmH